MWSLWSLWSLCPKYPPFRAATRGTRYLKRPRKSRIDRDPTRRSRFAPIAWRSRALGRDLPSPRRSLHKEICPASKHRAPDIQCLSFEAPPPAPKSAERFLQQEDSVRPDRRRSEFQMAHQDRSPPARSSLPEEQELASRSSSLARPKISEPFRDSSTTLHVYSACVQPLDGPTANISFMLLSWYGC